MTETTLFVIGFLCFGLTMLGIVLTVIEFKKGEQPSTGMVKKAPYQTATIYELRAAANS